jgi:transposase InsO family protein
MKWLNVSDRAGGGAEPRTPPAEATHPPRVRPELVATGSSQVWSWDITALKGPVKGVWYKCYVVLDIFSRYVTGWLVAAAEDAVVARDFLAAAVTHNGIEPHTIHADRGGAMTSKPVAVVPTTQPGGRAVPPAHTQIRPLMGPCCSAGRPSGE